MSATLKRLRSVFGDPLFIRKGESMLPTARALELVAPVRRVIDTMRTEILRSVAFEPAVSERRFVVLSPDLGEVHFLAAVLRELRRVAPRVRLATLVQPPEVAAQALSVGAADIALGYVSGLKQSGLVQQILFDSSFVCVVRQEHPCQATGLTLDAYLEAGHAVVSPQGRESVVDQLLEREGLRRRVVVEISHALGLLPMIEHSDLIATVPRDVADLYCGYADVCVLDLPLASPRMPVYQAWHEHAHNDAGHVWFRSVLQAVLGTHRQCAAAEQGVDLIVVSGG
jgi:DNA-binding transcriptional LysR family regulator